MDSREPTLRELTERARNDPQRMRARKTEADIIKMMPAGAWLSCTAISRLIGVADERKVRARLDRLTHDGRIERKREQGDHGLVYLYRKLAASIDSLPRDLGQLRLLISDLRRQIWNLEISIEANQDHALVQDIRTRRDNLLATVSTLETHLNDLGA